MFHGKILPTDMTLGDKSFGVNKKLGRVVPRTHHRKQHVGDCGRPIPWLAARSSRAVPHVNAACKDEY